MKTRKRGGMTVLDTDCFYQKHNENLEKCGKSFWGMLGRTINKKRRHGREPESIQINVEQLRHEMDALHHKSQLLQKENAQLLAKVKDDPNCDSEIKKLMEALQDTTTTFDSKHALIKRIFHIFKELKHTYAQLEKTSTAAQVEASKSLKSQYDASIAELKRASETLQSQIKDGTASTAQQIQDLNTQISTQTAAALQLSERYAQEIAAANEANRALQAQNAEEKAAHETQLAVFQQKSETDELAKREELESLLQAIQQGTELKSGNELMRQILIIFRDLDQKYETNVDRLQAEQATAIQSLQDSHSEAMAELKNTIAALQSGQESGIQQIVAQKNALSDELQRLNAEKAATLAKHEDDIRKKDAEVAAQMANQRIINAQTAEALRVAQEDAGRQQAAAKAQLADAQTRIQEATKAAIADQQARFQTELDGRIAEKGTQLRAAQEENERIRTEAVAEIAAEQARCEARVAKLTKVPSPPPQIERNAASAAAAEAAARAAAAKAAAEKIEKENAEEGKLIAYLIEFKSKPYNVEREPMFELIKRHFAQKIRSNQSCIDNDPTGLLPTTQEWLRELPQLHDDPQNISFMKLESWWHQLVSDLTEISGGVGQIFLKIAPQTMPGSSKEPFVQRHPTHPKFAQYKTIPHGHARHTKSPDRPWKDAGTPEFREIFTSDDGDKRFQQYFDEQMEHYFERIRSKRPVVIPIFMAFGQSGSGKSFSLCGKDKSDSSILDQVLRKLQQYGGEEAHYTMKQYYCKFDARTNQNLTDQGAFYAVDSRHGIKLNAVGETFDGPLNTQDGQILQNKIRHLAVNPTEQVLDLSKLRFEYEKGRIQRKMLELNKESSRSHVFINISFIDLYGDRRYIYIIDLAGNEGSQKQIGKATMNIIKQEKNMIEKTLTYVKAAVQNKRTKGIAPEYAGPYRTFTEEINNILFPMSKTKLYFLFTIRGFYGIKTETGSDPNPLIFATGVGDVSDITSTQLVTFPFANALLSAATITCEQKIGGGKEIRTSGRPTRKRMRRCSTRRKNNRRSSLLSRKAS